MSKAFAVFLILCLLSFAPRAAALTADEILMLKKNGVSDRTIELMLQKEIEEKRRAESSPQIIDTKEATTYSTGKPSATPLSEQEQRNLDSAWRMLENLSVEIETGRGRGER